MTRYISLISGKGGVGKTTSAINLGAALNQAGRDVIVVDGNITTPNVGLHVGVPVVPIHLHHVLQGKYGIKRAVYKHYSGMKIVPASIALSDLKIADASKMPKAIKSLNADFVLIDSSAGLGLEAQAAINSSDEVLVITNPEMPALTDALKAIRIAEAKGKDVLGVVLARARGENDVPISSIETLLEKPILGIIPEDKSVRQALTKRDAVIFTHPKSPASAAYRQLGASLAGALFEEQKSQGLLRRLFKALFGKKVKYKYQKKAK
ncbi:AAA family ATPase [archaeon]|nr:AAA family ATPase [archaeon]